MDPNGTDVYVYRTSYGAHKEICVDVWIGCGSAYAKKTGKKCYTYGLIGTGVFARFSFYGYIFHTAHDPNDVLVAWKKTSCVEDQEIQDTLEDEFENDNDGDLYTVFGSNCRQYSHNRFNDAPGQEMVYRCVKREFEWHGNSGSHVCVEWAWVPK